MQIMKIDPNEKYVLLLSESLKMLQCEEIIRGLETFMKDDESKILFIYGQEIAIVPANQIVGYKVIRKDE